MADKRFSELTSATSVADADILAISQGGLSKQLAASILKTYAQQGLSVGVFPFYNASSISDPINLTADNKLPFTKANGSASNIPLVV